MPPAPAPVLVVPRRMTKQALTTVSHTLERAAESLGASATVIGTFQHEAYFRPQAASFRRLSAQGVTTIAAYASSDPSSGPGHVPLAADDPLTGLWAAVLVSDSIFGYVYALDVREYADTTDGLEPARLFDARIGFDPLGTGQVAASVLDDLSSRGLDPEIEDRARALLSTARSDSAVDDGGVARAWAHGMSLLAGRLAQVSDDWRRERFHAHRDPSTGLSNREGLEAWIGGTADVDLPTGPIGAVKFRLDVAASDSAATGRPGDDAARDEVLVRVGEVVRQYVRRGDLAVRWETDEFVVLCPGVDDESELRDLAYRVAAAMSSVRVDGVRLSVDFGVQVCTRRPIDLTEADADLARA